MFEKRVFRVSKYKNWKKISSLETYEPEKRIEFSKEQTIPIFFRFCNLFILLGGIISFILGGFLMFIKEILGIRDKITKRHKISVVKVRGFKD